MLSKLKLPRLLRTISFQNLPFQKLRNLIIVCFAAVMLSGCVDYDVGVHFNNQHSGEITQTIRLGDRLAAINGLSAQEWLDNLDVRAKKLQGKTQQLSNRELQVKIPFTTDKDFVRKFNQFFAGQPTVSTLTDEPDINAHISLQQANWLIMLRNHLILDVDLTSLGISSEADSMLVNPGNLLNIDFHVDAPWEAKFKLRGDNAVAGEDLPEGMVWHLLPGQINHIEGYFWMPSPLGLSTLILIGLVVGAGYLKQWRDNSQADEGAKLTESASSSTVSNTAAAKDTAAAKSDG